MEGVTVVQRGVIERPEDVAHGAAIRFIVAMEALGLDVTSARAVASTAGVHGVRVGVVSPEALNVLSGLVEGAVKERLRAADLAASIAAVGCEQ
jgi:hypothetical protein